MTLENLDEKDREYVEEVNKMVKKYLNDKVIDVDLQTTRKLLECITVFYFYLHRLDTVLTEAKKRLEAELTYSHLKLSDQALTARLEKVEKAAWSVVRVDSDKSSAMFCGVKYQWVEENKLRDLAEVIKEAQ